MKISMSRVFWKKQARQALEAPTFAMSSELSTGDLENYYRRIILDCLRHWGSGFWALRTSPPCK